MFTIIDLLPPKIRRKLWRNDLGTFIKEQAYTSGLELGAKDGRSMQAVLKKNPTLHLIGMDLWEDMPDSSPYRDNSNNKLVANKRIRKFKNASLLKGNCLVLSKEITNKSLDFIFYDLYDFRWSNVDFVKSIFEAYLPKLKSSGILIGRDFNQEDIQQACQILGLKAPTNCIIKQQPHIRLTHIPAK